MTSPKLIRTFELLKLLSSSPEPLPLKQIADRLQIESSMLSRLVGDLIKLDMVEKASYRTVTAAPGLAQLGFCAAEVLPAAQCLRELWKQADLPPEISAAFAAIVSGKLYYYFRSGRPEAFAEPFGRSDLAAMIACRTPGFSCAAILEQDLLFFHERMEEAKAKSRLTREHAGRFRQLVLPVSWHRRPCAIGFLCENPNIDMDKLFFCTSRILSKLRSAGESEN